MSLICLLLSGSTLLLCNIKAFEKSNCKHLTSYLKWQTKIACACFPASVWMHKSLRNKKRLASPRIFFKCCCYAMTDCKKMEEKLDSSQDQDHNEIGKHSPLSHFLKYHTRSVLKFFYKLMLIPWPMWNEVLVQPSKVLWCTSPNLWYRVWLPLLTCLLLGVPSFPFYSGDLLHTEVTGGMLSL